MRANRDRMLPSPRRRPSPNTLPGVTAEDETALPRAAVKVAAAPRQFQTRWMVAVALLVLLGGLGVLYALPHYAGHEAVVVMARDVKMGQTITAADVVTADVSVGDQLAVVRPTDRTLDRTALTDLAKGSILSPAQVGDRSPGLAAGRNLVPVRLKLGQRPTQALVMGQAVLAVPAPLDPSSQGGSALTQLAPFTATVASAGDPDPSTGDVVVDVQVAATDAVGLARAAATGSVTLVVVPGGMP